ncbi:MAG: hypothetical protein PVI91_14535 [Gammaproteobacteria bacterium]|jgi:hypothetical protein
MNDEQRGVNAFGAQPEQHSASPFAGGRQREVVCRVIPDMAPGAVVVNEQ